MKKRFTLLTAGMFLFAGLLLTGCNTALTEKNGLTKAESGCEINAASFLRAAGGGFSEADEFTVKISFEGEVPADCICEPEDLTLTGTMAELGEKNFSVTNLTLGTKIQFTLDVRKNGVRYLTGKTEQIVVGLGKNTLYADIEEVFDLMPVWSKANQKLSVINLESVSLDSDELFSSGSSVSLDIVGKTIEDYVIDNEKNIYAVYSEPASENKLKETVIKYDFDQNYEKVLEFQNSTLTAGGLHSQLYFEAETETVYYLCQNSEDDFFYLYGAKTSEMETFIKKSEISIPKNQKMKDPFDDSSLYPINLEFITGFDFSVSDNNLYLLLTYSYQSGSVLFYLSTWDVSKSNSEPRTDFNTLFTQNSNELIEPAGLLTNHSSSGTLINHPYNLYFQNINSNCCKFTDIICVDNSLYLLFQNHKDFFDLGNGWNNSRGCVIQLAKIDYSFQNCFGWTYEPGVTIQTDPEDPDSVKRNYIPENIEKGFFGPEKVISFGNGEICFMDSGVSLKKTGNDYIRVNENHFVSLNISDGSWTSEKVGVVLGTEIGGY